MEKLLEEIALTAELMEQSLSPAAAAMLAQELKDYRMEDVRMALRLVRNGADRFSQKAVMDALGKVLPDGRPGADEAWAMLPMDESETVVMTEEMRDAWGIVRELIEDGDRIAARMAFRDAYNRIVDKAKLDGKKPVWYASLGHDATRRDEVLAAAVRQGRLSEIHALSLAAPRDDVGIAASLMLNAPLRLATVNGEHIDDAKTLTNVESKLAQLRAVIGKK